MGRYFLIVKVEKLFYSRQSIGLNKCHLLLSLDCFTVKFCAASLHLYLTAMESINSASIDCDCVGPDTPEVDQQPSPVWKNAPATLTCRVKHNGNVGLSLVSV